MKLVIQPLELYIVMALIEQANHGQPYKLVKFRHTPHRLTKYQYYIFSNSDNNLVTASQTPVPSIQPAASPPRLTLSSILYLLHILVYLRVYRLTQGPYIESNSHALDGCILSPTHRWLSWGKHARPSPALEVINGPLDIGRIQGHYCLWAFEECPPSD